MSSNRWLAAVGIWTGILLVAVRIVQDLASGVELGGTILI